MFRPSQLTVFFSCVILLSVQSSDGSEIIGGKEVRPHSLPYMALLLTKKELCGGILIDPSWVLTAAHCKEILTATLGVHSFAARDSKFTQKQEVEKRFPHPSYGATPYDNDNDLMLLKLKKPVKKTKTVKWLKLAKTGKDPEAGTICLVAGWGQTNKNVKKMSDVLRSVSVTVIDRNTCNSPDYYNHNPVITNNMVCAGSDGEKESDTCQGDSGGPLLCNKKLVGVTSFGKKCGLIKKPGVYSFLSDDKLDWIKKMMKSEI